ncbi:NAD(P)H-binding protein [Lacticaseibacillus porcinae]|uniref:NAD(P)H-binding protein n=1 Tax=Lacticaseibacillus porcinae TaxID=1123687 RepID=UPI000F7B02DE|nr:NAD(P)H-binding protein [Lacticaseibacillus porcinae]
MSKFLIIGATGTVGRATTKALRKDTSNQLVLFARHATQRLRSDHQQTVIDGDALRLADLLNAMKGVDGVLIAVSGPIDKITQQVVYVMQQAHITRVVLISSVGIYNEVPANIPTDNLDDSAILPRYRRSADIVEASDLNYTVLRPGWFTDGPINYQMTKKGEPFGGMYVSVSSIADVVRRAFTEPDFGHRQSIGLNTPEA